MQSEDYSVQQSSRWWLQNEKLIQLIWNLCFIYVFVLSFTLYVKFTTMVLKAILVYVISYLAQMLVLNSIIMFICMIIDG